MKFTADIVGDIISLLTQVSKCLLQSYQDKNFTVTFKEDGTEVTSADLLCQDLLVTGLKDILDYKPPVISEEFSQQDNEAHRSGGAYFLIDPIDGTRNFIHQGDFCINLTYVLKGTVLFGAIAVPRTGNIYYTSSGISVRYNWHNGSSDNICLQDGNRVTDPDKFLIISGGRSVTEKKEIMDIVASVLLQHGYRVSDYMIRNAAIKYCDMLEGKADMLINPIQTMDWDIASGCAILQNAGYLVSNLSGNVHSFGNINGLCDGVIVVREKHILDALMASRFKLAAQA